MFGKNIDIRHVVSNYKGAVSVLFYTSHPSNFSTSSPKYLKQFMLQLSYVVSLSQSFIYCMGTEVTKQALLRYAAVASFQELSDVMNAELVIERVDVTTPAAYKIWKQFAIC